MQNRMHNNIVYSLVFHPIISFSSVLIQRTMLAGNQSTCFRKGVDLITLLNIFFVEHVHKHIILGT